MYLIPRGATGGLILVIALVLYLVFRQVSQIGGASVPIAPIVPTVPITSAVPTKSPGEIAVVCSQFRDGGYVSSWDFEASKPGMISLCVFVKSPAGVYSIADEVSHQITTAGKHTLSGLRQMNINMGDFYGFRANVGIIEHMKGDRSSVTVSKPAKPLGVGSSLVDVAVIPGYYKLACSVTAVHMCLKGLGSEQNPANNAIEILQHYKANERRAPANGIYWFKPVSQRGAKDSQDKVIPVKCYCDFTVRPGHGYVLVGSMVVPPGKLGAWCPPLFELSGGNYSIGKYDPYNRDGTYFMDWSVLDSASVANKSPMACREAGYHYNSEGKYCAGSTGLVGSRLPVSGSVTEIMIRTGDRQTWVVIARGDLDRTRRRGEEAEVDRIIKPIALSRNLTGRELHVQGHKIILTKKASGPDSGDITLCGDPEWADKHGGIKVYVGGFLSKDSDENAIRGNPSAHMAPGRDSGRSTYKEAQIMCQSKGQKVCSRRQLKQAEKDGFGSASCGWTSDGPNNKKKFTLKPMNVDLWAQDEQYDTHCPVKDVYNGHSDIFCCDKFSFDGFDKLLPPWNKANVWILDHEQEFERIYGEAIPSGTTLTVHKTGAWLTTEKVTDSAYKFISQGGVNGADGDSRGEGGVEFHTDMSRFGINMSKPSKPSKPSNRAVQAVKAVQDGGADAADALWTGKNVSSDLMHFGAKIKLKSKEGIYVLASRTPYPYIYRREYPQVFGYEHGDGWEILPIDTGKSHGSINNGDIIALRNIRMDGMLSVNSSSDYGPRSNRGYLVTVNHVDNTDNHWRVHLLTNGVAQAGFWKRGSSIRLQHLNTGKVLGLTGTTHKTKSNGTVVSSLVAGSKFDDSSTWVAVVLTNTSNHMNKCREYLHEIAKARELSKQDGPDSADAQKLTEKLVDEFDKNCYDVPRSAYSHTMWKLYRRIRKQLWALAKESGVYRGYHQKEVLLAKNLARQEDMIAAAQKKLEYLRHGRCKPVRQCVDSVYNEPVSPVGPDGLDLGCKDLTPLLGEVKDGIDPSVLDKIKALVKKDVDINQFDIREHRDFNKYVKASDVESCLK